MPLLHSEDKEFYFVRNLQAQNNEIAYHPANGIHVRYDIYKLHLVLPYNHYRAINGSINKLLDEAVESLVIVSYKRINFERSNPGTLSWNDFNVPYTIYLKNDFEEENAAAVTALCARIEAIIAETSAPLLNREIIVRPSELTFGQRFIFRATNTARNIAEGLRVYFEGDDENAAAELKLTAEKSKYYIYFSQAMPLPVPAVRVHEKNALSSWFAAGKSPVAEMKPIEEKAEQAKETLPENCHCGIQ